MAKRPWRGCLVMPSMPQYAGTSILRDKSSARGHGMLASVTNSPSWRYSSAPSPTSRPPEYTGYSVNCITSARCLSPAKPSRTCRIFQRPSTSIHSGPTNTTLSRWLLLLGWISRLPHSVEEAAVQLGGWAGARCCIIDGVASEDLGVGVGMGMDVGMGWTWAWARAWARSGRAARRCGGGH